MIFLYQTKDDIRIIQCDSIENIYTWIDAAFAVHTNMRSHTGGAISFGTGVIHAKSSKQKINTKSSTEAEVVGLSEYLPYNLWLLSFLDAQGFGIKSNVIFQDNQSAMKMERNGRTSCTGNSRHIHIKYFFVKDRVDKGEVAIHYCPTAEMLADFFTKPLQGHLFHKFRDVIMGWKHISSLNPPNESALKERVESSMNSSIVSAVSSPIKEDNKKGTKVRFLIPPRSCDPQKLVNSNVTNMEINALGNDKRSDEYFGNTH